MKFVKMHGIGNDFVVVDCLNSGEPDGSLPDTSRAICHRKFGVGADGLILVLPSESADFRMRMFNPDGSEARMCGNGIRCFARYVTDRALCSRSGALTIETAAGVKTVRLCADASRDTLFQVDMGTPGLRRRDIPMTGNPDLQATDVPLIVCGRTIRVAAVSMGNPHAVLFANDEEMALVASLGPAIERHSLFPERANVQFVKALNPCELVVRTWERGAGETLACGTGACAALVAACTTGRTGRSATAHLPGGDLFIEWLQDGRVQMTGSAVQVYEGEFCLAAHAGRGRPDCRPTSSV